MEEFLASLATESAFPLVSALALGLMTAISPCPLATNITAVGYISKDLQNKNRVFFNGIAYTLGRILSYTGLAAILFWGAGRFNLSGFFQMYGEKVIGPLLLVIGLFMSGLIKLNIPGISGLSGKIIGKGTGSYWQALLLGVIFALAFCPYSGVLYFGMLIPLTISSNEGLLLPVVFAVATGIPVIIFAWLLAYTVSGVGKLYNRIKSFEIWFRRIIAVLFMGTGIYYIIVIYL